VLTSKQRVIKMTKRIMLPVESATGIDAKIAQHFGRAPYFAIVELDESQKTPKVTIEPNRSEHMGGAPGLSHESFLALKPDVVVAYAMGPGALNTFLGAGVIVLAATALTVKGNIESFKAGKLKELASGCENAHHHQHEH
jgi:predicted Fe-Mo cluster-binding NifX family protein